MDLMISDQVTTFVLTKGPGRNCFLRKKCFSTQGVIQDPKHYL